MKAPREKVFQAFADFETQPEWSAVCTRMTVTERAGSTVHLEFEGKFMGRKLTGTEKHVLTPPEEDRFEGEYGGMLANFVAKFEPVPEGTHMTVVAEPQFRGVWAKVLGRFAMGRFQAAFRRDLQRFANYVEAKK